MSDASLLAMPFGARQATVHRDVTGIIAKREADFKGDIVFEARGEGPVFGRETFFNVDNFGLLSGTYSGLYARRDDMPFVGLVLPHLGRATFRVNHRPYEVVAD